MSPEAAGRSNLGWVILTAALAVPGFLFYNWSSRLKADHDKSLTAKARNRVPDGSVFETPPSAARLAAPSSAPGSGPAAGAPSVVKTAGAAAPAAVPMTARPAPPPASAPPTVAAASPSMPGAPGLMPGAGAPPAPGVSAMAISSATVVLPRDPLISPLDTVRIHKYEQDLYNAQHPIVPVRPRRSPIKVVERQIGDDVDLQGIVTSPDGRPLAIVNDETLAAGASFSAPGHAGQVKIVSISADTVWFVYKNKRFKKVVTTE